MPSHANTIWYSLGGITFGSFVIAFITGFVLTQYYNPTPDANAAYNSVKAIAESPGVGLIRGIHYWSVNIGFALLLIHMIRVIGTMAYRPPRTVNYIVGILLLGTVFFLYYTGTVAKWDQEAFEALEHFSETGEILGALGIFFTEELTRSTSLLARMYGLHVGVFASLFIVIVVLHFLYIRRFGISPKPFENPEEYEKSKATGHTFYEHLRNLTGYGLILLAIVIALAYFLPPGLLNAPVEGVEVTKPPWPFLAFVPLEEVFGVSSILIGSIVILIGLLLIPVIGSFIKEDRTRFTVINWLLTIGIVIWLVLTLIAYLSPVEKHLG